MITVEQLQEKYEDVVPHKCCVGGALCLELRDQYPFDTTVDSMHFPEMLLLTRVLRVANPALGGQQSAQLARDIIRHNDGQDIWGAWLALKAALTYSATPETATAASASGT